MSDVRIKLKLKIKDVEVELTPEDAKDLFETLEQLVGPKKHYSYPIYWHWPSGPYIKPYWSWDNTYTASTTPQQLYSSENGDITVSWQEVPGE